MGEAEVQIRIYVRWKVVSADSGCEVSRQARQLREGSGQLLVEDSRQTIQCETAMTM